MLVQRIRRKVGRWIAGDSLAPSKPAKPVKDKIKPPVDQLGQNTDFLAPYNDRAAEIAQVYELRLRYVTPVEQPLILVSQVQRSGGTLISQLFDGHPECHAHPDELYIGYPDKFSYPDLDLSAPPEAWFQYLFEEPTRRLFTRGYQKHPDTARYDKDDVFPFFMLPNLQREIFLQAVRDKPPQSQRDVLNAYFTAYFNAWLDYLGLYQPKRFVTAFVPRVIMRPENVARLFRDYPDGRLISIIREPKGWYASSHKKGPANYPDPQTALPIWSQSAEAMIDNKRNYPDCVRLISFDDLLADTEGMMKRIADWAGMTWHPTLTEPTFQGMPIKANTAFATTQYGVIDEPRKRGTQLSPEDTATIDANAKQLYERVLKLCE